jgi:hypothetical protein
MVITVGSMNLTKNERIGRELSSEIIIPPVLDEFARTQT